MKSNIWVFSIEPLETRYTSQWFNLLPQQLQDNINNFNIVQINGVQKNQNPTDGAFLNFSDTNYWKSSQLCNFLEYYNKNCTTNRDHFLFTDAWNTTILQIKYMKELLGFEWKIHGLWHAGSYDPADFLGRLIGNAPWVRNTELAIFHSLDYNYFATKFHINLFCNGLKLNYQDLDVSSKIVQTGWPMEYLQTIINPATSSVKEDLIVFPHRIAPEKQVEIFKDLKKSLPQYKFVICQEKSLSKLEYHDILSRAKLVFSANLQETLGISPYEGLLFGAVPLVPDRLSYSEMYMKQFKYPSCWTADYTLYEFYKPFLIEKIEYIMSNYEKHQSDLKDQTEYLTKYFFSGHTIYSNFK